MIKAVSTRRQNRLHEGQTALADELIHLAVEIEGASSTRKDTLLPMVLRPGLFAISGCRVLVFEVMSAHLVTLNLVRNSSLKERAMFLAARFRIRK